VKKQTPLLKRQRLPKPKHVKRQRNTQKILLPALLLIALIASSCTSQTPRPEQITTWEDYEVGPVPNISDPLHAARGRVSTTVTSNNSICIRFDSMDFGCHEKAAVLSFTKWLEALRTNSEVSKEYAAALRQKQLEIQALVDAARLTERRANMMTDQQYQKAEELKQEEQRHFLERAFLQLILLGAFAL